MGAAQNLQSPLPAPALGQQLLAGIEGKAALTLSRIRPDVQTGPNQLELPTGSGAAQQQCAALTWAGCREHTLQNGELLPTNGQTRWRYGSHADTLLSIANTPPPGP
jgi:hypothetical protein